MNLNKTRTVSAGNFKVSLVGDGSLVPLLQIEGFESETSGYIDASELRAVGVRLIKWADKLDKSASLGS